MESLQNLLADYSSTKETRFVNRYLKYAEIEERILTLPAIFKVQNIGKSVQKRPIYSVQFGNGPKKVLLWSQMHGNESTTTKAVFDLLKGVEQERDPLYKTILSTCTMLLIPVLNPDGLVAYTRVNANGVDLNRDAKDLSQPESNVLDEVFGSFQPDFCFNLHDQRTIFSAGAKEKPATVSFLAPSYNEAKDINQTRKIAMQLIVKMNHFLQAHIPESVGRYDDAYNSNCVGDKLQSLATPTILFEAGHFPGDYQREETRKWIFMSLMQGFLSISKEDYSCIDLQNYKNIPKNEKLYYDIIIRNANTKKYGNIDIAIQYEEILQNKQLQFVPKIQKTGDLSTYFAHFEVDGIGKIVQVNAGDLLEKDVVIENIRLGNEDLMLNLNQY